MDRNSSSYCLSNRKQSCGISGLFVANVIYENILKKDNVSNFHRKFPGDHFWRRSPDLDAQSPQPHIQYKTPRQLTSHLRVSRKPRRTTPVKAQSRASPPHRLPPRWNPWPSLATNSLTSPSCPPSSPTPPAGTAWAPTPATTSPSFTWRTNPTTRSPLPTSPTSTWAQERRWPTTWRRAMSWTSRWRCTRYSFGVQIKSDLTFSCYRMLSLTVL